MRFRRILSVIICASLLFSSNAFAMEIKTNYTAETNAFTGEEDPSPAEETADGGVAAEPSASVEPIETEEPSQSAEPSAVPEPSETPLETESPMPTATPSPELDNKDTDGTEAEEGSLVPEEIPIINEEIGISAEDFPLQAASVGIDWFDPDNLILTLAEGKDAAQIAGEVTIPKHVTTIPAGLFTRTSSEFSIKFESGSALTQIAESAFKDTKITSIAIPGGVTAIEANTFKNCSNLSTVTFGTGLTAIGAESFINCEKLTAVDFSNTAIESIGESAFSGCKKLGYLGMKSLNSIGKNAFAYCTSLGISGISWSASINEIGVGAFKGCTGFVGLLNITAITTNADSITLGEGIFEGCTGLQYIHLPNKTAIIPQEMFKNCSSLKTVVIPQTVMEIHKEAFSGCAAMEAATLPENVVKIGENAYRDCIGLKTIEIRQKEEQGSTVSIAENAFPNKGNNITMKGYDGTVQDYAERMGYNFVTLYQKYDIKISKSMQNGTFTVFSGENPVRAGVEVTIKVTPNSGYHLKAGTLTDNQLTDIKLISYDTASNATFFRFEMPERTVELTAEFVKNDIIYSDLGIRFEKVNAAFKTYDSQKNILTMNKAGMEAQIVMTGKGVVDGKQGNVEDMGAWLFSFSSSDSQIASVTSTGLVTARKAGECNITAKLKKDSSKSYKFKVVVENDVFVSDIKDVTFSNLNLARGQRITTDDSGLTVIQFMKDSLTNTDRSFKVSFFAETGTADDLRVTSAWTSVDSRIAVPADKTSYANSNTITVKKGSVGESVVTIKVTNNDAEKTVKSYSFIVRVVDAIPRLKTDTISVNALSESGTPIPLVGVFGYDVNEDTLEVLQIVKKNGITYYEEYADHNGNPYITVRGGNIVITEAGSKLLTDGASKSYKNQFVISGKYLGDYSENTFRRTIPNLTITKKVLNPTVKMTGRINLFFKGNAPEQGTVKLTQSIKDVQVESYRLVSEANYKNVTDPNGESFAGNFNIDSLGNITKKVDDLYQINGKDVVSGYVYIKYAGYNEPVKKKITIPTSTSAPSYILSVTKASANVWASDQEYTVRILDKKTKNPISLDTISHISIDNLLTKSNFEDMSIANNVDTVNNTITLKVNGTPAKGNLVFNVNLSNWSKSMKFTFTLSTTDKIPKVKLGASKININSLLTGQEAGVTIDLDQSDSVLNTLSAAGFNYKGKHPDGSNIQFGHQNGMLTAKIKNGTTVADGSYTFEYDSPSANYTGNGQSIYLNNFRITVVVKNVQPLMKLKSAALTLNGLRGGENEVAVTTYTLQNVPAGSQYILQEASGGIKLEAVNDNSASAAGRINMSLDAGNGTINASLNGKVTAGSYKYNVSGLQLSNGSSKVDVKPFTITVKTISGDPKITLSSKSSLNVLDENSSMVYTPKMSNIVSGIEEVVLWEYTPEYGNKVISQHFAAELDEKGNVVIKAQKDAVLDGKITYRLVAQCELSALTGNSKIESNQLTIKPKQVFPKINTDVKTANVYAGQKDAAVEITLEKTSQKDVRIEDVVFTESTPENIKQAFSVSYDPDTQIVSIKLINSAYVKQNAANKITLETKCAHQMEKTTGPTFTVSVTVKK